MFITGFTTSIFLMASLRDRSGPSSTAISTSPTDITSEAAPLTFIFSTETATAGNSSRPMPPTFTSRPVASEAACSMRGLSLLR